MGRASDIFDWTPDLAEMARLAAAVGKLAEGEDDEGRLAIAWTLLNRLAKTRKRDGGPTGADFSDRDFVLALAALCRAWAGAAPDPTRGATRFHPHTELPGWARHKAPNALIGGNLFYAP